MNNKAKEFKVRTAEEIQGVISEIQISGVSFEKEVELVNNILNEWKDELIAESREGKPIADTDSVLPIPCVNHSTWSVDEIVEELKDIDAFDAAKYFFDKYGG